MADDKAQTALTFDASGAKKGAEDFKQAADQVIAADRAVEAAATKTAETVTQAETKKATARKQAAGVATDAAQKEVAASTAAADGTEKATNRVLTSLTSQTRMLNNYARSFDPLGTAVETAQRRLDNLNDVVAKGGPNADRAASLVAAAEQKLAAARKAATDAGADTATRLAEQTQRLNEYARAFDPLGTAVESAQKKLDDLNAIVAEGGPNAARATSQLAAAQDALTAAQTRQSAGDQKLLAERKALEAEMNPLKARSLEYAAALERVQKAVDLNIISEKQAEVQRQRVTDEFAKANAPLGALNDKLSQHTKVSGQAAFAQRQLGVQTVQFLSSVQGGQPFMMALIGQLHQVLDVMLATGTGFGVLGQGIKTAFGYLVSPTGLLIAAGAALVTMGVSAENTARRLGTLRNQLGGVRDDAARATQMAEDAARHLAATTSIGRADAFKAGGTILSAPQFRGNPEQLEQLEKAADKLSIRLGEDLPASAERFKKALQDPAQAAQELADKQLKGFDQALVDEIKRLQEAGDKARAFDTYLAAVKAAAADATREITPLQEAVAKLGEALSSVGSGVKSLSDIVGGALAGQLAEVVRNIAAMITGIKDMISWLDQHTPDWIKTAATAKIPDPGAMVGGWLHRQIFGTPGGTGAGAVDAAGRQVTTNDDAVGLFQLRRAAAADVGMTPDQRYDYGMNITGGLRYFRQQYDATSDIDTATRAYKEGLAGAHSGLGGGYLASVKNQDISKLPAQAKADIETAFTTIFGDLARTAVGGQLRQRILQIAMQENRGHHFVEGTGGGTSPGEGALTGRGQAGTGSAPLTVTPSGAANVDLVKDALTKADNMGLAGVTRTKAFAEIQHFQEALAKLREENKQDTPEYDRISKALAQARLDFQNAVEPADKLTESLDRQRQGQDRITAAVGKGSAAMAQATAAVKAEEEARGLAAVGTEEHAALVAKLTDKYLALAAAEQNTALGKQMQEMDLQVAGQDRLNAAYLQGTAAVIQVTAATKAAADARTLAQAGLVNEAEATKLLTAANVALAQSQAEAPLMQQMAANDNQITLIKAETDSLLMNNDAREMYLTKLRAELTLKQAGVPLNKESAQNYIKNAEALEQATLSLANHKQALDDVSGMFTSAFDSIGNAMTQAFMQGQGAAVNWKNVMTSVVQQVLQQLLKLAVLNPLLNTMFGGNRSTLGGVWDALNKKQDIIPGSTSTDSSSSGGIFGSILGWVAKGVGAFSGAGAADGMASGGELTGLTSQAAANVSAGAAGLHGGGLVGYDPPTFTRLVSPDLFANARRFHAGLGANEFAAILERGERVLTGRQQAAIAAAANSNSAPSHSITFNFPANTSPDNFRRAGGQVAAQVQGVLARARSRNG